MPHVLDASVVAQQSIIETLPFLPDSVLAIGYSGLQVTTQIKQSNEYETCRWIYEGVVPIEIKTIVAPCENRSQIAGVANISLLCEEENNQIIISLIIRFPIQNPVRIQVQCARITGDPYANKASTTINVQGNCDDRM